MPNCVAASSARRVVVHGAPFGMSSDETQGFTAGKTVGSQPRRAKATWCDRAPDQLINTFTRARSVSAECKRNDGQEPHQEEDELRDGEERGFDRHAEEREILEPRGRVLQNLV